MERATLSRRFLALAVDVLLFAAPSYLAAYQMDMDWIRISASFGFLIYYFSCLAYRGRTLGGELLGMHLITTRPDGSVSWYHPVLRTGCFLVTIR